MPRRALVLLPVAALLALAGSASAQAPPAPGAASLDLRGGLGTKKARYYAPFQHVVVKARVKPYVAGQIVTLHVVRGKKATKRIRRTVRPGGRVAFRFQVGKPGALRLILKHPRTAEQAAFRAAAKPVRVVDWSAGEDARGRHVLLLQRALLSLGFATPVSGVYDDGTARGVLAFRKTNEMGLSGYASSAVYAKLLRRQGAFQLRHPRAGKHVEFDWSRQVLVLADKGRPYRVYHSSSGAPATPTVFGSFRFYRKSPGTNSKGMVHSSYFIGGYAIHGYASVPTYPASHGCLRVPIPNAWAIFDWIALGSPIFVYR